MSRLRRGGPGVTTDEIDHLKARLEALAQENAHLKAQFAADASKRAQAETALTGALGRLMAAHSDV